MELIQAFETLHTIKYDVRSFDDPAVICEFTKDSLIKVFKDNKASFTKNLKVSNPLLKKCILSYNKERYE